MPDDKPAELTAQQIFDKVATHLHKQNAQARSSQHGCAYRAPDGRRCAVGCLLTDDEYDRGMEGARVPWLIEHGGIPRRLRPHADLLTSLQNVHDNYLPEAWPGALRDRANTHGLSPEVIYKLWGEDA